MYISQLFQKKSISHILRESQEESREHTGLNKNLRVLDLTALGIAAVVGAGIFSTIGNASFQGGPAVALLFVFTAIACAFSAMCYAEFASRIPISGSAYTYAYAAFGELVAWIIGWDLLMEYAVGNIAVAISWSDYFTSFMKGFGLDLPLYLTMDYLSAWRGFNEVSTQLSQGVALNTLTTPLIDAYQAWLAAPTIYGWKFVLDLPACAIVAFITYLVYIGIKESKVASNLMVLIKISIILVVIAIGAFYITPSNWTPFAPNGLSGVLKGVSAVFFAYIGFDAISTTAEECKNPQRDLPRAMFYSLLICTVLYVLICFVLTGMVSYKELAVGDPLAYVFQLHGLNWFSGLIAFSAIIAMASVLLVFQVGQPRIWMSMSRDGLLPKKFSSIHPKHKTPAFSTLVTGVMVGIPALFLNLTEVTDLTSIGTIFAFVLVSGGILFIEQPKIKDPNRFYVPYFNGRYYLPPLILLALGAVFWFNHEGFNELFFGPFHIEKIPIYIFVIVTCATTFFTIKKNFSLIPVLGLLINLYLMTELGLTNWLRFFIWLAIGLVIYFTYSYQHSRLGMRNNQSKG